MMHHEEELATACEILKPALKTMATLQSNVRWAGDAQDQWQPIVKCQEWTLDWQTACGLGPRSHDKHVKAKAIRNLSLAMSNGLVSTWISQFVVKLGLSPLAPAPFD